MKRIKKWLSLVTVTMFIASIAVTPVFAATTKVYTTTSYSSVLSMIKTMFPNFKVPTVPAPVPAPTPAPAPVPAPSGDFKFTAFEQRVLELVNIERKKAGLQPVVLDKKLTLAARAKAQDMVDKRYFGHTSPTYGTFGEQLKYFGISYRSAGENIASGQKTPEAVMKSWMNSPGHRANILSPKFNKMGVGYAYTSAGNYHHYWAQWFTN
ncbi:CAP domain-containing protein [Thermincola potens]|uniref:SCP-like extracellular n=1 Tax=Thermincola potens (strain JR) TaxID=635013 RepID=D5X7C2_THEPJ|nr:CAP domain-containing protein [Thermincola potens]ADG82492.1 SCP-like extracellular [Thermincola potens JR]